MAATDNQRDGDGDQQDPTAENPDADQDHDADGTPVGRADAVEDAVQSGADPADVASP